VIVDEHLATLSEAGERQNSTDITARGDPRRLEEAILIDRADEADFPTPRQPDGGFDRGGCFGGKAVGWHGLNIPKKDRTGSGAARASAPSGLAFLLLGL
jgi:hypothetical protein